MLSPERLEVVQILWARLMDREGVPLAAGYAVYDRLVAAYGEPHRHYHTLEHVVETLKVLSRLLDLAADANALMLAGWFHDAVYDPRATDNEARSADLARSLLGPLGIAPDRLSAIDTMILATRHRAGDEPAGDAALLVDADLAILGSAESRYRRYADAIRREYAHVPDAEYRAGRILVLEGFLARPALYRTERLWATGEDAARSNLRAEIERLRAGA